MGTVNEILAIVLKYEEPGWTEQTIECCRAAGITKIVIADRDGVGNMSKALNRAGFASATVRFEETSVRGFIQDICQPAAAIQDSRFTKYSVFAEYIWFVTNVTFEPQVPQQLIDAFEVNTAAVHPVHDSDHKHLRECSEVQNVPFVEFTAPMFSTRAAALIGGADEDMPYWGMDLDWSYRAIQKGFNLRVSPAAVNHVYLRHMKKKEPITEIRERMRMLHHSATEKALIAKYGIDWNQKLWPR